MQYPAAPAGWQTRTGPHRIVANGDRRMRSQQKLPSISNASHGRDWLPCQKLKMLWAIGLDEFARLTRIAGQDDGAPPPRQLDPAKGNARSRRLRRMAVHRGARRRRPCRAIVRQDDGVARPRRSAAPDAGSEQPPCRRNPGAARPGNSAAARHGGDRDIDRADHRGRNFVEGILNMRLAQPERCEVSLNFIEFASKTR